MLFFNRKADAPVAAPEEPKLVVESSQSLLDLASGLEALAEADEQRDADSAPAFAAAHCAAMLRQMSTALSRAAHGMRVLSTQSVLGVAHLDPNALTRILDRMDSLGDATLRQIEGRIGITGPRDDRKRLQVLRDEMRKWLDARDNHLAQSQLVADQIGDRGREVREELLGKADHLARAAQILAAAARIYEADPGRHATQEAVSLAASLRTLLQEMRFPPAV